MFFVALVYLSVSTITQNVIAMIFYVAVLGGKKVKFWVAIQIFLDE